jgi:hypothetical protein
MFVEMQELKKRDERDRMQRYNAQLKDKLV